MTSNIVKRAKIFAKEFHKGHLRKYTNDPYTVHLEAVAGMVASIIDDQNMVAAAWLHDTVEDTTATIEDIEREFGSDVSGMVADLTDICTLTDGNRKVRKAKERDHTAKASARAKTIKLADIIDNIRSIVPLDMGFARTYVPEKEQLMEVLKEGNSALYALASKLIEEARDAIDKD